MARIRTIKPEFWQDEKLAPLRPIDRLVFLGLISQADDKGRLVDNPRLLDGMLFPETADTCAESLDILARLARIIRYRSESGQRIIQIAKWEDHQRVDKPSKYNLPAPSDADLQSLAAQQDTVSSRGPREILATVSGDALAPTLDLGPTTNDLTTAVDKSTEAGASKNGPNPADEPPPIDTIANTGDRQAAYLAHFMPILREVGLSADDTNGSIIKALAKRRAPPRAMEEAIRGLPLVASDMNEGELRWIYAANKDEIAEPAWNKAKRAYIESQSGEVSDLVKEMVG